MHGFKPKNLWLCFFVEKSAFSSQKLSHFIGSDHGVLYLRALFLRR